jgi:hypothetical protein
MAAGGTAMAMSYNDLRERLLARRPASKIKFVDAQKQVVEVET